MTVRELIEKLNKCKPEMQVTIECWNDCNPTGVFKLSSPKQPDRIVIADDMAYFNDDIYEVGYSHKEVI